MSNLFQWRCSRRWLAAVSAMVLMLSFTSHSAAEASADEPGQIIADATVRIMALVEEAGGYFDEDPDRYYDAMGAELDQLVDFRSFARGVMGSVASSSAYRALDDAGKQQLRDQLDRFTRVMRAGLVQTYGRGLLAFGGSETRVADATLAEDNARIASVVQEVQGDEGTVYKLRYQMGQYRDGSWKLRNMIIENVNLGEVYRSQFRDALAREDGDIDQVIATWDTPTPEAN